MRLWSSLVSMKSARLPRFWIKPQPPQVLGQNLLFPDGVAVIDSSQLHVNFSKLPPAPQRPASACNGEGSPSGAFLD